MAGFNPSTLAIPFVVFMIVLLGYCSQVFFSYIEPGPLERHELYIFNFLVASTWISYAQACFVDPGSIPRDWKLPDMGKTINPARWCKKCNYAKPPRAHHCKVCKRCVPRMDHHCPWTGNCVSHRTFPHFMRFLFYIVAAMSYLTGLMVVRLQVVWNVRDLPSYLGPSPYKLAFLFILFALNSLSLFAIGIIFIRTVYSLATNITAIESWEIERHAVLVRRAKKYGGYLEGADGSRLRMAKVEFPYDIGIWQNVCQGMGGSPLIWFIPLNFTPSVRGGLDFETNDFNDPGVSWPPPDPDQLPRANRAADVSTMALGLDELLTDQARITAFRERQEADLRRRTNAASSWKNSEGESLHDFGVDEEVEEDDDMPIAQLIERRRRRT